MSRIGKLPIAIPAGVTVSLNEGVVTVKGPKGELQQAVDARIIVKVEDGHVVVERQSDERQDRSLHGLYRALINNMVTGVSQGFTKTLELVGVGYRASNNGQVLELVSLQISSFLVRFARRFVHSVSQSLIRVRVSSSRAKCSVVSLVRAQVSNQRA